VAVQTEPHLQALGAHQLAFQGAQTGRRRRRPRRRARRSPRCRRRPWWKHQLTFVACEELRELPRDRAFANQVLQLN